MLPVQRCKGVVMGSCHGGGAEAAKAGAPVVQVGAPKAGAARVARQHSAPAPLQLSILAHRLGLEERKHAKAWAQGADVRCCLGGWVNNWMRPGKSR